MLNENQYDIRKESLMDGVIRFTCIPKFQTCGTCKGKVEQGKMTAVKYPLIRNKVRYIINKIVCPSCYPQVKEILNNNPYK
jgi:hypothetical protein|tara:strand:- start:746 stop:988 length:243 start_codon:yes stop_codon:yes gene_type:complete